MPQRHSDAANPRYQKRKVFFRASSCSCDFVVAAARGSGAEHDRITPMFRRLPAFVGVVALIAPLAAQSRPEGDINARIRQEETAHSKIMHTLHMLTEVN